MKGIIHLTKRYLSSFLALFLLITAGTACFLTARLLSKDLENSAVPYLNKLERADLELKAAYPFREEDLDALWGVNGMLAVEGSFRADAIFGAASLVRRVKVLGQTERLDRAELLSGRMAQNTQECVLGRFYMDNGIRIGDEITIYPDVEGDSAGLPQSTLTVVGFADHPAFLRTNETDFVIVLPELRANGAETLTYPVALLRFGNEDRNLFGSSYDSLAASWETTLSDYLQRYVTARLESEESASAEYERTTRAALDSRREKLEAEESAQTGRGSSMTQKIEELTKKYEAAKAEWEIADSKRQEVNARFTVLDEALAEKKTRLEQLQSIDKIVRGELTQSETILSGKGLGSMLTLYRSCAESILSAFINADLTKPAQMENAVESARSRWDNGWDTFRQGLSEETAREIERSTSRSLVSLGLQISNQLRDYGNALTSAGTQNSGLQEDIRTIVNEQGSGALSSAIVVRMNQIREEITAEEANYQSVSDELAAADEELTTKQDAYYAVSRELMLAQNDYEDWKASEQERLAEVRAQLEKDTEEAERLIAARKAELENNKKNAWAGTGITRDKTAQDLGLLTTLSKRTAIGSAVLSALAILLTAGGLLGRMLRREKDQVEHRAILRSGRQDLRLKGALSLLIPAIPAVLAGTLLGRFFYTLAAGHSWSNYVLEGGAAGSFLANAALPFAVVTGLLLLGACLGIWAAWGNTYGCLEGALTFVCGALMSFSLGHALWLGWGLIRGRQAMLQAAPALTGRMSVLLPLILVLNVVLLCLLLPEAERFRADRQSELLYLMRMNGTDERSCRNMLGRASLLPACLGILTGVGLGFFAARSLQPALLQLNKNWKILPVWLVWSLAAIIAFALIMLIPSARRFYAVRDAVADRDMTEID